MKKISTLHWRVFVMNSNQSAYAKTKAQISFAVTAKLISAFVFATRKVQFLLYLTPKFQASSLLLCLYRSVCVGPVRKPHCWFSHEVAHTFVSSVASDSFDKYLKHKEYNIKSHNLDPVVQSIVSLTISLRHKFVKQISAKVTNTLIFFVEKM